jgi:hypothetical protein
MLSVMSSSSSDDAASLSHDIAPFDAGAHSTAAGGLLGAVAARAAALAEVVRLESATLAADGQVPDRARHPLRQRKSNRVLRSWRRAAR